jgi:hypothetical protein
MEEIVCISDSRAIRAQAPRIGFVDRMEVLSEVFFLDSVLNAIAKTRPRAQFVSWRSLDHSEPPKPLRCGGFSARNADWLAKPPAQPIGNLIADFSCASTKRSSARRSPICWKAPMRFHVILAVAAFALAGCNANQAVNPSSQPPSQVFAGHYEDTNPYNPISYAQNNTGRGGGR